MEIERAQSSPEVMGERSFASCQELLGVKNHNIEMSYDSNQQVGDRGVSIASLAIQKLGWIFREQSKSDHGIDAHIEIVESGKPTGKLIGLQIKSGSSYFRESGDDGFVFRGDDKKLDYWASHSLPVVILLVDVEAEIVYWQLVDLSEVRKTGAGWKLLVPHDHVLNQGSLDSLANIANVRESPGEQRLQRLRLDLELMRFLQRNAYNQLLVEATTRPSKSLRRTEIRILSKDSDGEESVIDDLGLRIGWSLERLLEHLFPWAETSIDEDHYAVFEDEDAPGASTGEWRPYEDDGEFAHWRIELVINDLGRSFLKVCDYLDAD